MKRLVRPAAVFATSSVFSLAALMMVDRAAPPGMAPLEAAASSGVSSYELARLELFRATMDRVRESYVEPERIDPQHMFTSALEAVERLVPEAMFRQDGTHLSIRLGAYRGTLEVQPIRTVDDLERELERVAVLAQRYLPEDAVPRLEMAGGPHASIEYAMANGALETLDPHSLLLPPAASREMDVDNRGEFGGLGMTIQMREGRLMLQDLMPGTPAAEAGLERGDHIRRIDGEPTINLTIDEAVELLRGHVGEKVILEIVRGDDAAPIAKELTRRKIKPNKAEGYGLGHGIAYVRLRTFHVNVATELHDELDRLHRELGGVRGLVLDLRRNPGGYLEKAIEVADTFLTEGEIVSTRGPSASAPSHKRARDDAKDEPRYPIAVLVDANSASASEIVAGALRNNGRAVIIGERTFGKGSVQNLLNLAHDSKLKITIAQYLTPGERSIQSVGIPADIQLIPSIVGLYDDGHGARQEAVLFGRERQRRESDLDAHLIGQGVRDEKPLFQLRYHRGWDDEHYTYDPPDPTSDVELRFAVDILRTGAGPDRVDLLRAAEPLVRRYAAQGERELQAAMAEMGVDWTKGPGVSEPELELTVDLGAKSLSSGEASEVTLTVTNNGPETLYRLVGVVEEHEVLGGLEFIFGRIAPGESRSATHPVTLQAGYPTESPEVVVSLRDSGGEVERRSITMPVTGQPLPQLAWSWRVVPPADGVVDVGDVVEIEFTVDNVGEGPTGHATARIRNRSGRGLDILSGTLEVGETRTREGKPCSRESSGSRTCRPVLEPGESWTGRFQVEVEDPRDDGYTVGLTLSDGEAYDFASVTRSGFYDYGRQEDEIGFSMGEVVPQLVQRSAPQIEIRRRPDLVSDGSLVTLSGRATDDVGIGHVVVYVNDDKVFFKGGSELGVVRSVPFSADVRLEPGLNTLSVLVEDVDGFKASASHVVWRPLESAEVMAGNNLP